MDYPTVRIALLPPPKPESQVTYFMSIWMALAGGLACLLIPVIGWVVCAFLWFVFIPVTIVKMCILSGKRSLAKDTAKKAAKLPQAIQTPHTPKTPRAPRTGPMFGA